MAGFIVLGLPRSRTTWLSRFLTYGDWICGHDELRHMRSPGDIAAWCSQPFSGSVETSAAPWWRSFPDYMPDVRVVTIRRPVDDVVQSLMAVPRVTFDRDTIQKAMTLADRKLDQIEKRVPSVLSVRYDELRQEDACARVFEHCLPYSHDHAHWHMLAARNVQTEFYALTRYAEAYRPAMERLSSIAKHQTLERMACKALPDPDGITIQTEDFSTWLRDARAMIGTHLIMVNEAPGDWQDKNLDLMQRLYDGGAMQITTARSNGRMFGYLMTLIGPSLTSPNVTTGTNTTFYADPSFPGLGMKIQRKALEFMRERGVSEVFMEAGTRASGPRIASIFRRVGAVRHGEVYRLQL